MVVAANSRAQTNQRMLELAGAVVVVKPGWATLAVLLDMTFCMVFVSRRDDNSGPAGVGLPPDLGTAADGLAIRADKRLLRDVWTCLCMC
jgi:hypothetical protein